VVNLCYYITSTLPEGTILQDLKPIFEEFNMYFSPIDNKKVKSQIRPGELYFRTTKDYCDCDTVLGSNNPLQEYEKLLRSKKLKSLKKKKWSNEQIQDWIMEKIKSKSHKTGFQKKIPSERDQELKKWMDFISSLLKFHKLKRIGLLKHWYNTNLEDEDLKIKETKRISIDELNSAFLLNLEEDVLYEFIMSYPY